MSEFFLELFSEEIPPNLQISARENLISNFTGFFEQKKINYHKNYSALSTPNRLIIYFESIQNEVIENSKAVLRFGGGCQGCGMVDLTLRDGVEKTLKDNIPELTEIVDSTDHSQRENAYYK